MKKISVIIPAYNEEKTIAEVVKKALKHSNEVIVVDDHSTDDTLKKAKEAGARVLRNDKNLGKARSLGRGVKEAKGEILVLMDGDGQHDADEIPKLIQPILKNKADLVLGSRFLLKDEKKIPFFRYLSNRINAYITSKLAGIRITDSECGFRAIKKELAEKITYDKRSFNLEPHMIIQAAFHGAKITEVPVKKIYNTQKSHVRKRDILYRIGFYIKEWWKKRRGLL